MSHLEKGMTAPSFTFQTAWKSGLNLEQSLTGGKIALYFLRYYGCPLCQLEIHNLILDHHKFEEKGLHVFVVLQSAPETLRNEIKENEIPFAIICDPDQSLYELYDVRALNNESEIKPSPALLSKVEQAKALNIEHGLSEGNELQLPAVFIINSDKKIEYAYYGKDFGDLPKIDDVITSLT